LLILRKREQEMRDIPSAFATESDRLVGRLRKTHAREREGISEKFQAYQEQFKKLCRDGQSSLRRVREDMEQNWHGREPESGPGGKTCRRLSKEALKAAAEIRASIQAQLASCV